MAKLKGPKVVYVCQQCGAQQPRWLGKCPECGEWNSLVEEKQLSAKPESSPRGGLFRMREVAPQAYQDIESQDDARQSTGINEFDRVLGGGLVPGSLVLIGGDPGIGKSTLLLEVADKLSHAYGKVLYISGEESERQIKLRGERLGINPVLTLACAIAGYVWTQAYERSPNLFANAVTHAIASALIANALPHWLLKNMVVGLNHFYR